MEDLEIKKINILALAKIKPFVYNDYLTYLELSLALAKKLNETIKIVNSMSDIVNTIDTNFTDIYAKIDEINQSIDNIYSDLIVFENRINSSVQIELQKTYNQIVSLMNDYQTIFTNNLQNLRNDLEHQIENIELGNVRAYDPTTGTFENVSTVIMNVYETLRNNAITCSEFDGLELTATQYDNLEITAYNFDVNGKTFLNVA